MHKILVFDRGFPQIPIACSGILKIPSGSTPCPRAYAPALGHGVLPSGIFKIPSGLRGIWGKIPSQKSEFSIQIRVS